MTLTLTENQLETVDARRKSPDDRPQYYNASTQQFTTISADFEAFLILQGSANNQTTQQWLTQCTGFASADSDRDALAAQYLQNEIGDATQSQNELEPLIYLFNEFRSEFNLLGFESVVECGLLLDDVQNAMSEIINLINRLNHRTVYGSILLNNLQQGGTTLDKQKELNSWYSPVTAY